MVNHKIWPLNLKISRHFHSGSLRTVLKKLKKHFMEVKSVKNEEKINGQKIFENGITANFTRIHSLNCSINTAKLILLIN